ncbi:acyltransferase family protein [Nostoc sp.]|uniref:acyltransferase family protein n=1 Tax=Nostoc sp. TaxID=1180 RepID=UPI002FF66AAC
MKQSRQLHLDSLRGIAALIVIIVHYLAVFYPYTVFGNQGSYLQRADWENIFFYPPFGLIVAGHFAVCLFFILSGYVLSYSHLGDLQRKQKILVSIIKRPIRLGGLVWFTIICGALLWHFGLFFNVAVSDLTSSKPWFSHFWGDSFNFKAFFIDLAFSSFSKGTIYNPPLWTIKKELYGSIMVYLFLLLLGSFKYRILVYTLLVILFRDSLYQGFWIGLLIADIMKNYSSSIKFPKIYCYLLLILFVYLSSYPHYVNQDFLGSTIYKYLPDDKGFGGGYPMISALSLFLLAISSNQLKKLLNLPFLQFLGGISYGLYVIHFLVIGSFSSWLFLSLNSYFSFNISFLLTLLSGLPFIIFTAYLATKYVDNPSIRLADYLGNKIILLLIYRP